MSSSLYTAAGFHALATTSTDPSGAAAAATSTILETIDPATISYPTTDLEDPAPAVSDPHTSKVLEMASTLLRSGQVIGMPTETVYGLAANALDAIAAKKIFEAKKRPQDNPLIVHVSSLRMLRSMLKDNKIPPIYDALIREFWPGPLTLLFPRSNLIPNEITCGQETVAVRFPSHPIARALISVCDRPLAAPSANSSGKPSPTLASHVMDDLAGKIPMVIDGGQCSFGIESTVVDGLRTPPAILRPGGVTYEQIRSITGMEHVQVYKKHFTDAVLEQAPTTPGMKYRHYSPEAEVVLVEHSGPFEHSANGTTASTGSTPNVFSPQYTRILSEIQALRNNGKTRFGILRTTLTLEKTRQALNGETDGIIEFSLGQGSKPDDVARELFRGLRFLDGHNVDTIFVEGISEDNEGMAVMNRVRKAASRTIS
ncbi:hypothetical protein BGW38_010478 [Lunasporangiospora selenospora]|uniref:Threonylcarbamoyl-AMP synthase n=1 Tax=Lunasporangiospora selenospora TaxID=979761 RepID=A0A9P6FWG2_9FUNG|nr:hypothetical protein BGW38_010478 [Lunasporangiospora selenospora]